MAKVTLRQALEIGLLKHQSDQFREAEEIYRQVLHHDPSNADALHFLGVLKHQRGDNAAAAELLTQSIGVCDSAAAVHHNLGLVLGKLGRHEAAIESFRRTLELDPAHAEAWNNLGTSLREVGDTDGAHAACSRAVELNPKFAEAYNCLAAVLTDQDRLDEAVACWRKAIALNAHFAEAHRNCAAALIRQRKFDEAVELARKAVRFDPKSADALNNLALALAGDGKSDEAIEHFRKTIALRPAFASAYGNLAGELSRVGNLTEAIDMWREGLAINEDDARAHNDLANALANLGRADEALSHYRRALEVRPDFASAHSNLLLAMNYLPQFDGPAFLAAHRQWERQHVGLTGTSAPLFTHDRTAERVLRVGYVSPDFREHPVGRFIEPLIAGHDRGCVHVTCYAIGPEPDEWTDRLRAAADEWRDLTAQSDVDAAERIRLDEIDILVDLAGHTGHNRIQIFAQRPAPVQVTYLGYPNTTGLTSIDYRLTDELADPAGEMREAQCGTSREQSLRGSHGRGTDAFHTEALVRLPRAFLCYVAPAEAPEVKELPCARRGHVTFGCFNNLAKITPGLIDQWAGILRRVPQSRIVLKSKGLSDAAARQCLRERFRSLGVDADRVEALPPTRTIAEHLGSYGQVDISLDTFPYHGTTTTMESLWMGVPVVCQAGALHVSRVGVSILSNLGLTELIAASAAEYADAAVKLAEDREKLHHFRHGLRDLIRRSPLMDVARFTTDIEDAYRRMWRTWCQSTAARDEPQVIRF